MSNNLRLIPSDSKPSTVQSNAYGPAAPSAPALHDTLRSGEGPLSVSSKINNRHPLEARIQNWDQHARDQQLESYRRIFGAADPIKREMELSIVEQDSFKPMILGGGYESSLQKDILLNRETTIDWEDIYTGFDSKPQLDFHTEMEKKFGI
ncbi:hypothetical protein CANARDRAFT_30603 [[Candida] arabinofermentans NRRL YB-2248]|uniref:Proteasome maturation factor UMP1 n=1 Tax=[Candida] arabinofermentans NRRL YB-2248 TaxID=983967 RepID=A0A1E4STK4_9ASCO|nr:hypothetical protein CANARDRAFT_30603 [[Candida] arabinofermentans NRRL YB-2248]